MTETGKRKSVQVQPEHFFQVCSLSNGDFRSRFLLSSGLDGKTIGHIELRMFRRSLRDLAVIEIPLLERYTLHQKEGALGVPEA